MHPAIMSKAGMRDWQRFFLELLPCHLRSWNSQYMKAIKSTIGTNHPLVSPEDLSVMFYKIPDLHAIHAQFVDGLKKLQSQDNKVPSPSPSSPASASSTVAKTSSPSERIYEDIPSLGDLFKSLASRLGAYSAYLKNYSRALETVQKCSSENNQFSEITRVSSFSLLQSLPPSLHHDLIPFIPLSCTLLSFLLGLNQSFTTHTSLLMFSLSVSAPLSLCQELLLSLHLLFFHAALFLPEGMKCLSNQRQKEIQFCSHSISPFFCTSLLVLSLPRSFSLLFWFINENTPSSLGVVLNFRVSPLSFLLSHYLSLIPQAIKLKSMKGQAVTLEGMPFESKGEKRKDGFLPLFQTILTQTLSFFFTFLFCLNFVLIPNPRWWNLSLSVLSGKTEFSLYTQSLVWLSMKLKNTYISRSRIMLTHNDINVSRIWINDYEWCPQTQ